MAHHLTYSYPTNFTSYEGETDSPILNSFPPPSYKQELHIDIPKANFLEKPISANNSSFPTKGLNFREEVHQNGKLNGENRKSIWNRFSIQAAGPAGEK